MSTAIRVYNASWLVSFNYEGAEAEHLHCLHEQPRPAFYISVLWAIMFFYVCILPPLWYTVHTNNACFFPFRPHVSSSFGMGTVTKYTSTLLTSFLLYLVNVICVFFFLSLHLFSWGLLNSMCRYFIVIFAIQPIYISFIAMYNYHFLHIASCYYCSDLAHIPTTHFGILREEESVFVKCIYYVFIPTTDKSVQKQL